MLKNREFYFSDPKHFNDPVDCQIGIYSALKAAVDLAEKENETVKSKLQKLGTIDEIFRKIENGVKRAAIFSLSNEENNVLMWSHYADSYKGFSSGFSLSNNFTEYNEGQTILLNITKPMQLLEPRKFTIQTTIRLLNIFLSLLNALKFLHGMSSGFLCYRWVW